MNPFGDFNEGGPCVLASATVRYEALLTFFVWNETPRVAPLVDDSLGLPAGIKRSPWYYDFGDFVYSRYDFITTIFLLYKNSARANAEQKTKEL